MVFRWYGDKVVNAIKTEEGRRLSRACLLVERDAKLSFGPRHSKGTESQTAPGETPSVITGTLRRSITHETDALRLVGRVGSNVTYARIQEKGGFAGRGHRTYIPARPYLRPALDRNMREISIIMGRRMFGA